MRVLVGAFIYLSKPTVLFVYVMAY